MACFSAFFINFDCRAYNLISCVGVEGMKGVVDSRAVVLGEYIIENKATVRATAKQFNVSKSTVHKDVAERLKRIQPQLYGEVKKVLDTNKAQRHIRGGIATKMKYIAASKQAKHDA